MFGQNSADNYSIYEDAGNRQSTHDRFSLPLRPSATPLPGVDQQYVGRNEIGQLHLFPSVLPSPTLLLSISSHNKIILSNLGVSTSLNCGKIRHVFYLMNFRLFGDEIGGEIS